MVVKLDQFDRLEQSCSNMKALIGDMKGAIEMTDAGECQEAKIDKDIRQGCSIYNAHCLSTKNRTISLKICYNVSTNSF